MVLFQDETNESGRAPWRRMARQAPGETRGRTPAMQVLRDLFHPDCDRRLWHLTRSADPGRPCGRPGARGLLHRAEKALRRYRRWGIAPRPENAVPATRKGASPGTVPF
jgi:hypothetical protein